MQNNELLSKVAKNKKLMFIVPNLIYIYKLFYYYNSNFDVDHILEVSFREVLFLILIFFVITCLFYFLLLRMLKDKQKVFIILCFICCFYFFNFNLIQFLLFIVFVLFFVIIFKKIIKFRLDVGIVLISFIAIILCSFSFVSAIYNCCVSIFKARSYDNNFSVKVDFEKKDPNIYYIHCDGMLGIGAMKKYFQFGNTYLIDYLEDNNFYLNEDANFVNGHKTQRALVALFNPNYYDNFFKEYLDDIEDYYMDKKDSSSFYVSYYELEDKRLNNELFIALKKKKYTTIGIGEFNQYTSLDTDYYYDYSVHNSEFMHLIDGMEGLRYIDSNKNSKMRRLSYIGFTHFKSLLDSTMFKNLLKNVNYLNYENINYKDYDASNYEYINDSKYWISKAILKSLDDTMKVDNKRFVFIDYNLNHLALTFDRDGNRLEEDDMYDLSYYVGNYIYSTYLLVDILNFIKSNDEDAVIVIEGDHGIHMLDNEYIMNRFSIDMNGVKEIRNSVISSVYIPDKYKNGDEIYLDNPLNISRYLVNNYVGDNYEYIK